MRGASQSCEMPRHRKGTDYCSRSIPIFNRHPELELPGWSTLADTRTFVILLHDNISPRAGDDGLDLSLLVRGHTKFVESLLEIIEKCFPFRRCDPEMLVRFLHGTTRI